MIHEQSKIVICIVRAIPERLDLAGLLRKLGLSILQLRPIGGTPAVLFVEPCFELRDCLIPKGVGTAIARLQAAIAGASIDFALECFGTPVQFSGDFARQLRRRLLRKRARRNTGKEKSDIFR